MSCCDYNECNQGRSCPVRATKCIDFPVSTGQSEKSQPMYLYKESGRKVAHGKISRKESPVMMTDDDFFQTVDAWLAALRWPIATFAVCMVFFWCAAMFFA